VYETHINWEHTHFGSSVISRMGERKNHRKKLLAATDSRANCSGCCPVQTWAIQES